MTSLPPGHQSAPERQPAPKVSVIMAAYNASATLERAIQSVLSQDFREWELIVVDDGSTDATAAILDRYASEDSRIRAVHQPNAGVSAVRRLGTELAAGEYVIHFDADDYAEAGMLGRMLGEARHNGADITVADFYVDHANGTTELRRQCAEYQSGREMVRALLTGKMHGGLWNKLIRRSAYARFGADFGEGLMFGEDMVQVMKMIDRGASVGFMPEAFYHYCYNNAASLTCSPSRASYLRRRQWISECEKYAGGEFAAEIDRLRFNAKFFALVHGLTDRKDFYSYGPTSPGMLSSLSGYRKFRPAMLLACCRLYGTGRLWCRLVHRIFRQ